LSAQKPTDKSATVKQDHDHDHDRAAEEISPGDITPPYPSTPTTPAPLGANPDSYLRLTHENLRAFNDHIRSSAACAREDHMRKKTSPVKKDKKKAKNDRASHPLNLPPDELRRLSAAIAREDGAMKSMDYDASEQDGAASPPAHSAPPTPMSTASAAFPDVGNGVHGAHPNGAKSPTPPPHRVPPKPPIDAEACKAAGNKFFKARDYSRAITEYSKGKRRRVPNHVPC
jgi:DnaJ homolog subfamily C member 7